MHCMLTFTIIADINFETQREFIQTTEIVMKKIRKEKGCISCHLVKDTENEKVFLLMEEWKTREDLFRHVCSDCFGALSGALQLLSNKTETKIYNVSFAHGIEKLAEIRAQNKSKKRGSAKSGPGRRNINRSAARKKSVQSL
jgi:quinol monooxygenase YgiN